MRRREFVESEFDRLTPAPREGQSVNVGYLGDEVIYDRTARRDEALRRADAAERAGVTWDPEEPEVLWISDDPLRFKQRVTADGKIWGIYREDQGWVEAEHPTPMESELARRLLAERAEKPDIAFLPDGDREAIDNLARWLEEERESRDLGGEIREAEAVRPEPRFARIVRCRTPTYWYAGSVGRIFEILGENPENFLAIQGPGLEGWVGREDCEIVPILRRWQDLRS